MIVAERGDDVFLSDEIGVINLKTNSHTQVSVEAAAKFGYWDEDMTSPRLEDARNYELAHSSLKRT